MRIAPLLACVIALCVASAARGETLRDEPCAGCLLETSNSAGPRPLLTVLHGDEGSPAKVFAAWRSVAVARDVVLFAPRCPSHEGCSGSWWQWDGDPAWLEAQVDVIASRHAIDEQHRMLAGWSGGATYMGMRSESWSRRFASLSFADGGMAGSSCDPCPPRVRYLAGGRNPLRHLAEQNRDALERCGHDVRWELAAGLDHAQTWQRHVASLGPLLDGMLADTPCVPAAASAERTAPIAPSSAPSAPRPPAPPTPPAPRCSCEAAGARESGWPWLALAFFLARRRPMTT